MAENAILISGCAGDGTSTLPKALAARGMLCVPEPGRRIIREEQERGGEALRWINPRAFARRAIAVARSDLAKASAATVITFFERGPVDAAVALAHAGGLPLTQTLDPVRAYARTVFLAAPWPEI